MTPIQDHAWNKWQYRASNFGRILLWLNLISGATGTAAVVLLLADHPLLTKVVALAAAIVTLYASFSGLQAGYEKAKFLAELYSRLAHQYENLWNLVNQGLDEETISAELAALNAQESILPSILDQEYDDRLRNRVYQILVESKGLTT